MGCVGFEGAKRRNLEAILGEDSERIVKRSLRICKSKGCQVAGRSRSREIFGRIHPIGSQKRRGR